MPAPAYRFHQLGFAVLGFLIAVQVSCTKQDEKVPTKNLESKTEYSLLSEFPDLVQWHSPDEYVGEETHFELPVLLLFTDTDCGFCECLQIAILSVEEHAAFINMSFFPVQVRGESNTNKNLRSRFGIKGVPVLIALTPEGEELGRLVGWSNIDITIEFLKKHASHSKPVISGGPRPVRARAASAEFQSLCQTLVGQA